jgi:hypothetical protein
MLEWEYEVQGAGLRLVRGRLRVLGAVLRYVSGGATSD